MGARPPVAMACVHAPVPAQLKVASEALMLVEPAAYTCAASVPARAPPQEPADVSVHVAVKVMGAGVTPAAQLTGPPTACSARRDDAVQVRGVPMMAAIAAETLVLTGGEQLAPAGCESERWGAGQVGAGLPGGAGAARGRAGAASPHKKRRGGKEKTGEKTHRVLAPPPPAAHHVQRNGDG